VDGPSAAALGTLARDRWRALGKTSLPRLRKPDTSLWPEHVPPDLLDVDVMIARTMPRVEDEPEVRENEALFFDAIRAAERTIYVESQYFTNTRIADAFADRLRDRKSSSSRRRSVTAGSNSRPWERSEQRPSSGSWPRTGSSGCVWSIPRPRARRMCPRSCTPR